MKNDWLLRIIATVFGAGAVFGVLQFQVRDLQAQLSKLQENGSKGLQDHELKQAAELSELKADLVMRLNNLQLTTVENRAQLEDIRRTIDLIEKRTR